MQPRGCGSSHLTNMKKGKMHLKTLNLGICMHRLIVALWDYCNMYGVVYGTEYWGPSNGLFTKSLKVDSIRNNILKILIVAIIWSTWKEKRNSIQDVERNSAPLDCSFWRVWYSKRRHYEGCLDTRTKMVAPQVINLTWSPQLFPKLVMSNLTSDGLCINYQGIRR